MITAHNSDLTQWAFNKVGCHTASTHRTLSAIHVFDKSFRAYYGRRGGVGVKYSIDWNIMKRNILIVFIAILFILFLIQRCNRTTLAQYLDSKGVEVEKMSIKDTEVIYRGLFGEEPNDFMIESQEEKVEFISQLNDTTIRRDYISEIQLQLFGKTSRSVDMNPSSNQIITTGLNDPDSNLRVSIAIFNGRRISVNFINIDEEKVYSPGLIGYIMGDYFEYSKNN